MSKRKEKLKHKPLEWSEILAKKEYRVEAARQSLLNFILIYLADYVQYAFADFHEDLEADLYDDKELRVAALMFRESAKTVFCSLVYPLWSICYQKKKFIIYGSSDADAAASLMMNLINHLQDNALIANDFGRLYFEEGGRFSKSKKKTVKDFITTNGIRVFARGVGQKVRGYTHGRFRPDLFIGDDLEGIKNITNKDNRDKVDDWLHSEVLSAINQITGKAIVSGNMLHRDCLMARLDIKSDVWSTHKVAIHDDKGEIAWNDRFVFTDQEALEVNANLPIERWVASLDTIKRDKGSHIFNQEYLLKPLSDEDQVIFPDNIQWYDKDINFLDEKKYRVIMAVDPAISQKESADYSACTVWAREHSTGNFYCLDFFNVKITFQILKEKSQKMDIYYKPEGAIVEKVAAQDWLIQDLRNDYNMIIYPVTRRADKRLRLVSVSHVFEQNKVFFRRSQQIIVDQLLDFGAAAHDDLVDTVVDCLQELSRSSGTKMFKNNGII